MGFDMPYFVDCEDLYQSYDFTVKFSLYEEAKEFADKTRLKCYTCTIYNGVAIDEELRAKRYDAMEELTALDQEMGLYDVSHEDNPLIRRKVDTDKEEIRIV